MLKAMTGAVPGGITSELPGSMSYSVTRVTAGEKALNVRLTELVNVT
jgi:hypothetical protein